MHGIRRDGARNGAIGALGEDHHARQLHAAARRAGHGAGYHQNGQHSPNKGRPEACVDRHIAGRADDGNDLEQSVVNAVGDGREFRGSVDAHEQRNAQHNNDKRAQLAAAADAKKLERKDAVKQAEAHAAQGHEYERDVLRIRAVGRHTVVADAEAAGGHRAERNVHRVKQRYVTQEQQDDLQDGHCYIYLIQKLCRLLHARHEL